MADYTIEPQTGGAGFDPATIMRVIGAGVSLGLLVGMGVWGYKLVVRDATGIPVVAAMEGPMRDAPANPGGMLPLNTGLAVNEVAALGAASEPEDVVLLAPETAGLTEEDLIIQPTAEADEIAPGGVASASEVAVPEATVSTTSLGDAATADVVETLSDAPMTAEQILALADELADGVAPLEALNEDVVQPTLTIDGAAVEDAATASNRIDVSIPGVTTAYRPPARPAGLAATLAVATTDTTALEVVAALETSTLQAVEAVVADTQTQEVVAVSAPMAIGTSLVQLGAFDTAQQARDEWATLTGRFADFMAGKEMVIQEAVSGGSAFYRLRAIGFADIADARRFCTVLEAEQAACVPVMVQ